MERGKRTRIGGKKEKGEIENGKREMGKGKGNWRKWRKENRYGKREMGKGNGRGRGE
jgi:hypothetical protein